MNQSITPGGIGNYGGTGRTYESVGAQPKSTSNNNLRSVSLSKKFIFNNEQ